MMPLYIHSKMSLVWTFLAVCPICAVKASFLLTNLTPEPQAWAAVANFPKSQMFQHFAVIQAKSPFIAPLPKSTLNSWPGQEFLLPTCDHREMQNHRAL